MINILSRCNRNYKISSAETFSALWIEEGLIYTMKIFCSMLDISIGWKGLVFSFCLNCADFGSKFNNTAEFFFFFWLSFYRIEDIEATTSMFLQSMVLLNKMGGHVCNGSNISELFRSPVSTAVSQSQWATWVHWSSRTTGESPLHVPLWVTVKPSNNTGAVQSWFLPKLRPDTGYTEPHYWPRT